MPISILARIKSSIPPFQITIEEHNTGWDAAINEVGSPRTQIGTFQTLAEAKDAALAKVKESFPKDAEFPPTLTWTTSRAVLPPEEIVAEPPSLKKFTSVFLPVAVGLIATVLFFVFNRGVQIVTQGSASLEAEVRKATDAAITARHDVESLKTELSRYEPSGNAALELAPVKSDIKQLKERFDSFEIALGDTLDRRIAVPLMRKDI